MSAQLVAQRANVVPFRQSLMWHAAATHVLRQALARATHMGLLDAASAQDFAAYAERNMDVAEVRLTIGQVLTTCKERKHGN